MAKIISLTALIFACILLIRAEPPINSYATNTENNGFEFNSNVINGAFMTGKEGHRESADYYSRGSSGHLLTNSKNQGTLEESLRSNSYSGFSPSSQNTGFTTYSSGNRENFATSPYFANNVAQSNFDSYASTNANGDSPFEAYTQGSDQASSDFNQISVGKHKSPSYIRYIDNLSGATSTENYPDLGSSLNTEATSFKADYSGDSYRSHAQLAAGFVDGSEPISFNRDTSNLYSSPNNDFSYGKPKDSSGFGGVGYNKFINDAYSIHPETRYVRGSHGNVPRDYISSMFLSNSGSSPFSSSIRSNPSTYGSAKLNKYNKYVNEYTPNGGSSYPSKEQDVDYLFGNYGKVSGKPGAVKDTRINAYGSQPYLSTPAYVSKIVGSYKSKPNYMSMYPSSPIGYSSMSGLHNSFSGTSYADGSLLRRYRSSSYVPGHGNSHSGYYQ